MKKMVSYLLALFFLSLPSTSYSQDKLADILKEFFPKTQLSNSELNILRQELKIQTIMIKAVKEIQLESGQILDVNQASNTIKEAIKNASFAKSTSLSYRINQNVRTTIDNTIHPTKIKNHLINFNQYLKDNLKKRVITGSALTRRFGAQIGLVYLVAAQVDYTIPIVLMLSGEYVTGLSLFLSPVSLTTTATFAAIQRAVKQIFLLRTLGFGRNLQNEILASRVRSFFKQRFISTKQITEIHFRGKNLTLSYSEENLFMKIQRSFGFSDDLNLKNLITYLEQKNMRHFIDYSLITSDRAELLKLLTIISEIEQNATKKQLLTIHRKFNKSVNILEGLPDYTHVRQWALKAEAVKSFDELMLVMKDLPDDIPPKVFDKLWRNRILKNLTKEIGDYTSLKTYKTFRNLYSLYDKNRALRADFYASVEYHFKPAQKVELIDYMYKALAPVGSCEYPFLNAIKGLNFPL